MHSLHVSKSPRPPAPAIKKSVAPLRADFRRFNESYKRTMNAENQLNHNVQFLQQVEQRQAQQTTPKTSNLRLRRKHIASWKRVTSNLL